MTKKYKIILITIIVIIGVLIAILSPIKKETTLFICKSDIDSDGIEDCLYIKKEGSRKTLTIDFGNKDLPQKNIDITKLNPQGLQVCNLDGGREEIFINTKKSTLLHPEVINRPFFFNIKDNKLIRKWTGSTFGHPYREVFFLDIDGDGSDKVYTISETEKGEVVYAYCWFNFGFIYLGHSDYFEKIENLTVLDNRLFAEVLKNNKKEKVNIILKN